MITAYQENQEYNLRLIQDESGVSLVITDRSGETLPCGYICTISHSGITLYKGIDIQYAAELGLSLDSDGSIAIATAGNLEDAAPDSGEDEDEGDEW